MNLFRAADDLLHELLERHGIDQEIVADRATARERHRLGGRIDRCHLLSEVDRLRQSLGDAIVKHSGAEQGKLELVVWPPRNIIAVLEEVFEDATNIDIGHPVTLPGGRHHLERMGPDLEIVRHHKILGDAGTENRIDPILKVVAGQATLLSLDDTQNALMEYLRGQAVDIVLERIWHEAIEHPYPGFPQMLIVVAAQHLLDEIIEVAVMAEHDMSAMVPDEAVLVGVARRQTANMVVALEHLPVFVTKLGQPICRTKPRGSRADNDDLLAQAGLPLQLFSVYSNVARSTSNLSPPRTPWTNPER